MKSVGSFTIDELRNGLDARTSKFARRLLAETGTYEDFLDGLYEELEDCLKRIEEDPKVHRDDSEDRISREIINMLSRWYDASHDELIGGHSDIVVRGPRGFLWVAEAKIHGGYDYMLKGFQQLTTRYMRGTPNADQGALLMYIRNGDTAGVVEKWAAKIDAESLTNYERVPCPVRQELGFRTSHRHASSGRPVLVRHIGISMHWDPQDV